MTAGVGGIDFGPMHRGDFPRQLYEHPGAGFAGIRAAAP